MSTETDENQIEEIKTIRTGGKCSCKRYVSFFLYREIIAFTKESEYFSVKILKTEKKCLKKGKRLGLQWFQVGVGELWNKVGRKWDPLVTKEF